MKKLLLYTTTILLLSSVLHSTSFNCQKASTFVEQAICTDEEASYLNEALSFYYKKALSKVPDSKALKIEHQAWLKNVRNRCKTIACIQTVTDKRNEVLAETIHHAIMRITGKYASDSGNLKIGYSEGILFFELLIADNTVHTAKIEGEIILKNHTALYHNKAQNCNLMFTFAPKEVTLVQKGSCTMESSLTATGLYKSMTQANARMVIGEVGDSMASLFYAKSNTTYKKYCTMGVEENAGKILCRARNKSGEDSSHIIHIFSGESGEIYGNLPPLHRAKRFMIESTL